MTLRLFLFFSCLVGWLWGVIVIIKIHWPSLTFLLYLMLRFNFLLILHRWQTLDAFPIISAKDLEEKNFRWPWPHRKVLCTHSFWRYHLSSLAKPSKTAGCEKSPDTRADCSLWGRGNLSLCQKKAKVHNVPRLNMRAWPFETSNTHVNWKSVRHICGPSDVPWPCHHVPRSVDPT
jgi:hypothetical protein